MAVIALKSDREAQRKARNGRVKGIWASLKNDLINFQEHLKEMGHEQHSIPCSIPHLRNRYSKFLKFKFHSIIDGRHNNTNAQVVTPEMISLWKAIYAGQRAYKPTYIEVAQKYLGFLAGEVEIIDNSTGELFNHQDSVYKPASESTIYSYQTFWENRVATHSKRSGDRQKFKSLYEPFHQLEQPKFAGSIISIDDRQPPFEYAPGKRMWFYNGIDLGSEAFTTWVYGDTKEGIIVDFYRQMVRNYAKWGFKLPSELECESSLNSSFADNLLQNGAMFNDVRIEANNARGKRIEAYFRPLRYGLEKKEEGWLARPFALSESNQVGPQVKQRFSKAEIVKKALRAIQKWNNTLHSNQELHPGMTRWDVFVEKQHPALTPINWAGILPHIGKDTETSMHLGRIKLQGKNRVVGFDGQVATGDNLIKIMSKIEGQKVRVKWLDDHEGQVLKSLVYDMQGTLVCELLGDLKYSRAKLERTPEDFENRELMSAYAATVQGYIRRERNAITNVVLLEKEKPFAGKHKFVIDELGEPYSPSEEVAETLPQAENEYDFDLDAISNQFSTSTKDRI